MKSVNKTKKTRSISIAQLFIAFIEHVKKQRSILVALAIFCVATASFMWPMFTHVSSYSEGGDHMFNAWTLARNHQCLTGDNCPNYSNGNIFFPHKDTMLYSETQLSAGILTLPLYLINHNPLFAANIWYLLSALFSGFFMYLLARYLSKGNQPISILSGLLFEFAPTKISSMSHLQNLSIFYLPLIILLLLKYRDTKQKRYLIFFALSSSLLFLASWYQMVFGLVVIGLFILYLLFQKPFRQTAKMLIIATGVALLPVLPLAREYVRFSKETNASFSINSQVEFSASVNDYVTPYSETPVGTLIYKVAPKLHRNSYNPDSFSYTGITLYAVLAFVLVVTFRKRKNKKLNGLSKQKPLVILLAAIFVVGVLMSLGPIIKYGNHSSFPVQGLQVSIPGPYLLVDVLLPQLSFIRAIGRASIIALFALCSALALLGAFLTANKQKRLVVIMLIAFISLDLLPIRQLFLTPFKSIDQHTIGFSVPDVYKYVRKNPEVDSLIVARTQRDYSFAGIPFAPAEDVLWSGYHNRNVFNGYSGYEPPEYKRELTDFTDLRADDLPKFKRYNIHYYLVDKELSKNQPQLVNTASKLFSKRVYEDNRYVLFKI